MHYTHSNVASEWKKLVHTTLDSEWKRRSWKSQRRETSKKGHQVRYDCHSCHFGGFKHRLNETTLVRTVQLLHSTAIFATKFSRRRTRRRSFGGNWLGTVAVIGDASFETVGQLQFEQHRTITSRLCLLRCTLVRLQFRRLLFAYSTFCYIALL